MILNFSRLYFKFIPVPHIKIHKINTQDQAEKIVTELEKEPF